MIFEALMPSGMANRSSKQIRRALSDREIQPFDEGGIQFWGDLGIVHIFSNRAMRHQSPLFFQPWQRLRSGGF